MQAALRYMALQRRFVGKLRADAAAFVVDNEATMSPRGKGNYPNKFLLFLQMPKIRVKPISTPPLSPFSMWLVSWIALLLSQSILY